MGLIVRQVRMGILVGDIVVVEGIVEGEGVMEEVVGVEVVMEGVVGVGVKCEEEEGGFEVG